MMRTGKLLLLALLVAGVCGALPCAAERRQASFGWKLRVAYPEIGHGAVDADLGQWLDSHLNKLARDMGYVALMPDAPEMNSEMDVDYSLSRPSDRAVSVVFQTYVYPARAAHGVTGVDVRSYDLRSGTLLSLEDVFGDPEAALDIMSRGARRILEENIKASSRDGGVPEEDADGDIVWFTDGFAPTRENFANLVLEPGGVRAIFQQYQVLPYVYGLPEAFYPLPLLAPASPKAALWGK